MVVRMTEGDSKVFDVKVWLHRGSAGVPTSSPHTISALQLVIGLI